MCGIFGCIGHTSIETVQECINRIRYRGPDACSVKQLQGACLGHCRLSIIDLDHRSDQPMCDASGRYWIVYNGEIYNYIEIRKELQGLGYSFNTSSDTEVILYAFIEWGEEFQDKCNGMWALAIWDNKEKVLFLSRDRFGIKPLYYYISDDCFYFGSEMKSFFPIMESKDINYDIFDNKNWFGYEATDDCVILRIKKIRAGYCAIYKNRELITKRWWCTLDHLIDVPNSYDDQVALFRDLFVDSCRIRMRSDVPIGTALSGGVDSSSVAGVINSLFSDIDHKKTSFSQNVFVASMPYSEIDETSYAEKVAEQLGLEIQKVSIDGNVRPTKLIEYIYYCEDPYITSPVPFIQTYKKMKESGVKVTIDGHGADELFGGYTFDLPVISQNNLTKEKIKEYVDIYNSTLYPSSPISEDEFLKKGLVRIVNYSDDEWDKMDWFNKKLYNEVHFETLPTLLRNYDKYSMCNGVEIRMPFMDYRIVEFAFSIASSSKVRDGFTKRIVRDMARPFISDDILFRKHKIGFNSPMTEWYRGDMKEFMLDIIRSKDFLECDLINPLAVTVMMEHIIDTDTPSFLDGEKLWTAMMPYFWKKAMIG